MSIPKYYNREKIRNLFSFFSYIFSYYSIFKKYEGRKNEKKFSIPTFLFVLLAGVAGCGNNNSTSNVSSSSVNNSSTSESTSVVTSTNTVKGTEMTFDETISYDGVFAITKDAEDSYVVGIYYDLYDYLLGAKADYIPFIASIENCVDIIWLSDKPEGYQYLIEYAPSDYLDNFKNALVEIYGYTKVNSNTNTNTGLKIELKEDYGYQQFILSII